MHRTKSEVTSVNNCISSLLFPRARQHSAQGHVAHTARAGTTAKINSVRKLTTGTAVHSWDMAKNIFRLLRLLLFFSTLPAPPRCLLGTRPKHPHAATPFSSVLRCAYCHRTLNQCSRSPPTVRDSLWVAFEIPWERMMGDFQLASQGRI